MMYLVYIYNRYINYSMNLKSQLFLIIMTKESNLRERQDVVLVSTPTRVCL